MENQFMDVKDKQTTGLEIKGIINQGYLLCIPIPPQNFDVWCKKKMREQLAELKSSYFFKGWLVAAIEKKTKHEGFLTNLQVPGSKAFRERAWDSSAFCRVFLVIR